MSRPRYVLQVGQAWCGRVGAPQFGQVFTLATLMPCVARRLSRRAFEVFRLGTAMAAPECTERPTRGRSSPEREQPGGLDGVQEGTVV
jgi:hypothetical protein